MDTAAPSNGMPRDLLNACESVADGKRHMPSDPVCSDSRTDEGGNNKKPKTWDDGCVNIVSRFYNVFPFSVWDLFSG